MKHTHTHTKTTVTRCLLLPILLGISMLQASGQNISGLQNKKLIPEDNVRVTGHALLWDAVLRRVSSPGTREYSMDSVVNAVIKSAPGSVNGWIDSIVVVKDDEYYLKLKVYYKGFDKAFFQFGTLSAAGKREKWASDAFDQQERNSPAEIVFELYKNLPEDAASSSSYLFIDIWGSGSERSFIYRLEKLWTADRNIIEAELKPIGATASLSHTNRDVMPAKKIVFADGRSNKTGISLNEFQAKLLTANNAASTEPLGPDNKPFNLWDGIAIDNQVNFSRPQDISNINMSVYPDKNLNSGVYYILPADFHLSWSPEIRTRKGYGFSISYSKLIESNTGSDADAAVRMAASLTTGITEQEKQFVSDLLKAIDRRFRQIRFLELKENIQTNFQQALTAQFDIPADKITVTTVSDLSRGMKVEWVANPDRKEFIQTSLVSGDGLSANVSLKPKNQDIIEHLIPANISFSDPRSLGKMILVPKRWREKYWINPTSFPLKLKYLHVMKKSIRDPNPVIYTWDLNNLEVAPNGKVSFEKNNKAVPNFLDFDYSTVFWISYSVMECKPCADSIINSLSTSVDRSTTQRIKFTIPANLFDTLKADYFLITIRSRQATAKGEQVEELPALKVLKDDTKDYYSSSLFVPAGKTPDFEYNIKVLGMDGDFYISEKWIKETTRDVYLGKSKLIELFKGVMPWIK